MAGKHKSPRPNTHSIKYKGGLLHGPSFELVHLGREDYVSTSADNKKGSRIPESRDSHILSTRELISALGSVWDCVSSPLSLLVPKSTCRYEDDCLKKCSILWFSSDDGTHSTHGAADYQTRPVNLMTVGDSFPMVSECLRFLTVREKISFAQPSGGTYSLFRRYFQGSHQTIQEPLKENSSSSTGLECDLLKIYGWMTEITLSTREHRMNFGLKKDGGDCYSGLNASHPTCCHTPLNETSHTNNLIMGNEEHHGDKTELTCLSSGQNDDHDLKSSASTLWAEHGSMQDSEASRSKFPNSILGANSLGFLIPFYDYDFDESGNSVKPDLHENKINHQLDFSVEENSEVEICYPIKEKPTSALAKQEHALAGAMAGIFVSLSLYPVDTVKTVVQSCCADQKSLHEICQTIISQRGISGLYRGITTNIASSAPISAVYTFTYESVKGILLPFLPKEHQSVAHCMAGGCARIATSFIFTPSERIKQQMQVGSRYQNCWNAFIGITEKGGLPSLYTGWGAVLCRNVPHSIIKFYTYESLKQLLSSIQLDGQTNTFTTLVSGGLAASTAAVFTTPFDVVKTRLQTQIPGSLNRYPGVFDTLREIAKNEGLKGLYRGLTPRLFMYMTQGGIFFASYESFKRLFSVEGSRINSQANAHKREEEEEEDDEEDPLFSLSPG